MARLCQSWASRRGHLDAMRVEAEAKPEVCGPGAMAVEELQQRIGEHFLGEADI